MVAKLTTTSQYRWDTNMTTPQVNKLNEKLNKKRKKGYILAGDLLHCLNCDHTEHIYVDRLSTKKDENCPACKHLLLHYSATVVCISNCVEVN